MKLLICLITYNRLAYTKRTLKNLWDSISDDADYFLVVTDNKSADGTQEYLRALQGRKRINMLILNPENYYPGRACNEAWTDALEIYDATHLMRLDNDMQLTKGWDKQVENYFKKIPELGQLGIDHEAIETPEADLTKRFINGVVINEWPGCVGGPMIMSRKLWDKGFKYDETPWKPGLQEDSKFSQRFKEAGYLVGHAQEELGRTFANKSNWKEYPEYYKGTFGDRGITNQLGDI